VLDASWLHERHRYGARDLARRVGAVLVELRCECPAAIAEARIEHRNRAGTDASEATVEVARTLATSADPWPGAHPIDTSEPLTRTLSAALTRIEALVGT